MQLADPDAGQREKAREFVRSIIDCAGQFGAAAIIGSMQGPSGHTGDPETARGYLCEALEDGGSHAAQYNVPLIYEPLNRYETRQCCTVADGVNLLESLSTDNVRLLCDLFHMNIEESDIADALVPGANGSATFTSSTAIDVPSDWDTCSTDRSSRHCERSITKVIYVPRRFRSPIRTRRPGKRCELSEYWTSSSCRSVEITVIGHSSSRAKYETQAISSSITFPPNWLSCLNRPAWIVGEFVVVQSEQSQQRDVEVANVMHVFDRGGANLVGGADGVTGFAAATGHPDGHGIGIVVTTVGESAAADSVVRCSSKFAHPDDQCLLQQTTIAEVTNQRRNRLVDRRDQRTVRLGDVIVRIPRARVDLHEPNALFDQLAGQQAASSEVIGRLDADPVTIQRELRFVVDAERLAELPFASETPTRSSAFCAASSSCRG